eukprot:jgi/Botrbrau1/1066/Bobra.0076s0032.1
MDDKDVEAPVEPPRRRIFRELGRRELIATSIMMILNISPLIVMLIVQHWEYRIGLGVAALWALILFFVNYILWRKGLSLVKVHSLHVAFIVIMGLLFIASFLVPEWFYHTYFRPIFHWCIFLYALVGFLIRRPFVLDFLEGAYSEDVLHEPIVLRYAMYATIPWIFSLAVNATCSTIKDVVTVRVLHDHHLALLIALGIPLIAIVGAAVATGIVRRRLNAELHRMFPQGFDSTLRASMRSKLEMKTTSLAHPEHGQ